MAIQTKIVECVPNFSEGRDKAKIEQIRAKTEQIRHSETDTGEYAVHSWMEAVKKARESDG